MLCFGISSRAFSILLFSEIVFLMKYFFSIFSNYRDVMHKN